MALTKVPDSLFAANPHRKNLIINGNMAMWQRAESFTAVSNQYVADRWYAQTNTTTAITDIAKQTIAVSDNLPFQSYLWVDVTTADASLAVGDAYYISTRLEGLDVEHLMFGMDSAVDNITLSFYHRHTKTGTYCVSFRDSTNSRSYVAEYTQTTSGAWEKAVIVVPGDTGGANWAYDTLIGLSITFTVMAGSDFQTSANTWESNGSKFATSNQVNALDSVSNFFRFSEVQLEVGSEATEFEHRHRAIEAQLCERYYRHIETLGASGYAEGSSQTARCITSVFYSEMRVAPTIDTSTVTSINGNNGTGDILTIGTIQKNVCSFTRSSTAAGSMNWRIGTGYISMSAEY